TDDERIAIPLGDLEEFLYVLRLHRGVYVHLQAELWDGDALRAVARLADSNRLVGIGAYPGERFPPRILALAVGRGSHDLVEVGSIGIETQAHVIALCNQ